MKVLHTSDWHLGARIGRVDRADDAFARIAELMGVVDEEEVDLLLVAGDIFDETRAAQLGGLVRRLAELLAPRVSAGLRVVFLAGNHDREHVFPLLEAASALFGPTSAGRVTFAQRPQLLEIPSRTGDEAIALACLPYPTHYRYDLEARGWPSGDVRNRELANAVRARIVELAEAAARLGSGLPLFMAAHVLVRGAEVRHGAYCLSEAEDVPVERGDLPAWDYIALGHIHKPQELGHPNIRYSGSIERMDLGEAHDDKSAVLVTVTGPRTATPRIIPLAATPFAAIEAMSEEELVSRRADLADPDNTLVSLVLKVDGTESITKLVAKAHDLFPRLYRGPEIHRTVSPPGTASTSGFDRSDVAGTVLGFLRARLGDDDPEAREVLALAEELLASEDLAVLAAHDSDAFDGNTP